MKIFRSIIAMYNAGRVLHDDEGGAGAKLFVIAVISGQLFPVPYRFFAEHSSFGEALRFFISAAMSILIILIVIGAHKSKINKAGMDNLKASSAAKWCLSTFVFVSFSLIALAARISPYLGVLAWFFMALLPLDDWLTRKVDLGPRR